MSKLGYDITSAVKIDKQMSPLNHFKLETTYYLSCCLLLNTFVELQFH